MTLPESARKKQVESGSADLACTRCRERKIKCDRARPSCSNCQREDGVSCQYSQPIKRVNHLKLLCDSMMCMQERVTGIENSLARLDRRPSLVSASSMDTDDDRTDDEESGNTTKALGADLAELHVSRQQNDVDYCHGPCSLYALCQRYRLSVISRLSEEDPAAQSDALLQAICQRAGRVEAMPFVHDQRPPLMQLPPKEQAIGAIAHLYQNLDCMTDVFVQEHLESNVERLYSGTLQDDDEPWVICIKAIVLLALFREVARQLENRDSNAFFGKFARSMLPSPAALWTPRLIVTPRLINIQALILLSIAARQLDPLGCSEFIFASASIIARMMGLEFTNVILQENDSVDKVERAKVLLSMYCWDNDLHISRGSISWLSHHDMNMVPQLSAVMERRLPYADRLQLAMIQDGVHRLSKATLGNQRATKTRVKALVSKVESQIRELIYSVGIFDLPAPFSSDHTLLVMDVLAVRILALQHRQEEGCVQQMLADSRSCCLLLAIAANPSDLDSISKFNSLNVTLKRVTESGPAAVPTTDVLTSVLDRFPSKAFFVMLERIVSSCGDQADSEKEQDHNLLRRVVQIFQNSANDLQTNSYLFTVAATFDRLLSVTLQLGNKQDTGGLSGVPPDQTMDMINVNKSSTSSRRASQPDLQNQPRSTVDSDDMSQFCWVSPTPPSTISWDALLTPNSNTAPIEFDSSTAHGSFPVDFADPFAMNDTPDLVHWMSLSSSPAQSTEVVNRPKKRRLVDSVDEDTIDVWNLRKSGPCASALT